MTAAPAIRPDGAMLSFHVPGIPRPKGSLRAFIPRGRTRPIVTADNANTRPWQRSVAIAANAEMLKAGLEPFTGPVRVDLRFWLPRPKRTTDAAPVHKPDLDKLVRAILDALTMAHVYADDAQVCCCSAAKMYSAEPGVMVTVE